MTAPGVFTPYSTIAPLLGTLPGWVDPLEQQRIASYQKYEEIYWSSEEGFTQVMRGDNEQPLFLPTARTLVNTVARYTCPDLSYTVTPSLSGGSTQDVAIATLAFKNLFDREDFFSKFDINVLFGLIRADALWHFVADPLKPLGKRISIRTPDPASYFPVYDVDDPERIIKVHLAEQVTEGGQVKVSRLTYEKVFDETTGAVVQILRSHGVFKTEDWWNLTQPERWILPPEPLPDGITAIPVYHWKNFDPTAPFGSSELRGLESVLAGINQAISDEDYTLAMEGLGVWATDGAGPVDEDGNAIDWVMGPARVLTKANGLRKLNGTTSLGPYGEHIDRLSNAAKEAVGASDVAVGTADAATAESGVALLIRLGPMLASTGKKDKALLGLLRQMFYDLCFWLQVYEELPLIGTDEAKQPAPLVVITPVVGPKIPVNQAEVVKRVVELRNTVPPVVSLRTAHDWMRSAGIPIPDDELKQLQLEASQSLDPVGEPTPGQDADADASVPETESEEVVV